MKLLLLWGIALGFTAYSMMMLRRTTINFGNLLLYLFTGCCWIVAIFHRPLLHFFTQTAAGKVLLGVLAAGGVFFVGMLCFVVISGYSDEPSGKEKAIVVLGAGLREDRVSQVLRFRLDAAYAYWENHRDMLIVTTGGQGRGETVPEGWAMKQYLIGKGVPEEMILSEEKSTSTEENFSFARVLLEEKGIGIEDGIICVTNAFHCYRARQYARMAGYTDVQSLPAAISPTSVIPCYSREVFAVLYYWVFRSHQSSWITPLVGWLSVCKRGW